MTDPNAAEAPAETAPSAPSLSRVAVIASYAASATDVIELPPGRDWAQVQAAGIKYDTLFVTWRDGTTDELPFHADIDLGAIDTKRPDFEVRAVDDCGLPDWSTDPLLD